MRKRNELIWFLPLCFVFLSLIMIKFCTPRINEKYIVEAIKRENIELFVDTKGTVQAKDLINIGLDIDMGVDNIYFKQGDKVKKDAVKINLDYNVQEESGYNYGLEGTYITNSKENNVKIGIKAGYVF